VIEAETTEFIEVGQTIGSTASCPPGTLVSKLADEFFHLPSLDSIAVVEEQRPIGLITRQKFLFTVFRRFGWEVYGRKTVDQLMDRAALVIPAQTRLDQALALAVGRKPEDVYDELIVIGDDGRYAGLLSVRQMIIQHSHALANILLQKDVADARARELEKVSELKSQFLANVTHELRSPVNAIIELAELVRMSAESGYVGQVRDRLSLLLSSATNLRSIITNILDLSKIEAGRMQVIDEEFDLIPLLREIVETTRVLIGSKPIDVILDSEPSRVMVTDPVKVRQILLNLTSNAAKFTDEGRIRIEQSFTEDAAVIRVADTGIGIRREDQERLFEAFSQLEDAKSKRHQGTGLGLAITREMLDLVGGAIALESAFGAGTIFTVSIPNRKGAEEPCPRNESSSSTMTRPISPPHATS
jgi:signal transduction histidine kinase